MIRRALFLIASALAAAPAVSYSDIRNLEKAFDRRISNHNLEQPMDLIGFTRGAYLPDYGVVFTAEVNLLLSAGASPFRPQVSAEEKSRLRQRKLARVPEMKRLMRDMMVSTATTLKTLPMERRIAVGVSFFYHPFEDTQGLPKHLLMEAPRKTLVEFEAGRLTAAQLDAALTVQEN
jgi:hypothetical protein